MNVLKYRTALTRAWSTAFLAIALSTGVARAASIQITSFTGDQATVVGEGFVKSTQSSFQVNIYVNGDFTADVNTNSNGSFSYTTPSGKVQNGSQIEVKVLNWNGSGQHWSQTLRVGGGSQPQPQEPPPYRMSESELREYANQQARTVANRVVKTYGELEKWKYNFTIGYWQGIDDYNGSYRARVDFDDGAVSGRSRGGNEGYVAGQNQGSGSGSSAGSSAAVSRFRAIVNTGKEPNVELPAVTVPSFGGLTAPADACNSVNTKTNELESQLSAEMRRLTFCDTDLGEYGCLQYDATAYSIRLQEIYGWGKNTYHFVDSWFRADYAWSEWANNDLGGRYNKTNYRKLQSDQQSDFRRYFESIYNDVIDEKYLRKKTEYNSTARSRGQWYGVEIAARQSYDRGCNQAYAEGYTPASVNGFRTTYENAYRTSFDGTVRTYKTRPVATIDGIRLVDGNGNGVFELGENVGIVIGNVTNLGRVAAKDLPIRMSGDGLQSLANRESITIEASTSMTVNKVAPNLAQVRMDVTADRDNLVQVAVGEHTQQLSYLVSWKGSIQALATASSSEATSLKQFVLKNIQDEYTANEKAKNNAYSEKAKKKTTSKLRDLVEFYEALPENQRANIREMGPTIVKMQEVAEHNKWSTGRLRKDFAALAGRIK
jgi:hypothetical protein